MAFQSLFHSRDPSRDKFLARLFGIFYEEIFRCWAKAPQAPYEDLGRPTIKCVRETKSHTLDSTLRSKEDTSAYIVEMKCWLEYENYRYQTLESPSQLEWVSRQDKTFPIFLDATRNTDQYTVKIKERVQAINGTILIWASYTEQGRQSVIDHYGFKDVLSLETIIDDLVRWQNQDYAELIHKYETWCGELFTGLRNMRIRQG